MIPYKEKVAQDSRLIILRELAAQVDGRMNEVGLQYVLETFGVTQSREYVRTQLLKLAALDAVAVADIGTVMVAELRALGRNHVERREIIDGVTRPSDAR